MGPGLDSTDWEEELLWLDEAIANGQLPDAAALDSQNAGRLRTIQLLRLVASARSSDASSFVDTQTDQARNTIENSLGNVRPRHFGRFQISAEIGRGSYGIVFLAVDRHIGRRVALKIPHVGVHIDTDLRKRFQNEARAAANLEHPNIVQVFDAGQVGPIHYIASAYCPGVNLHEWLAQHPGPCRPVEAAEIVRKLADAIAHANQRGIFHRDLKPANVILQLPQQAEQADEQCPGDLSEHRQSVLVSPLRDVTPKITDFGLAKFIGQTSMATLTGAILGTPAFMAPEQANAGQGLPQSQADVYSLGAILYQMLTGRTPFEAPSPLETLRLVVHEPPAAPRSIVRGLPRDLETICLKCLEKRPADRYASASLLSKDLQRFLDNEPIAARPAGLIDQYLKWVRRKPLIASLSFSLVTSVLVSLMVVSFLWIQSVERRIQAEDAVGRMTQAMTTIAQQDRMSQQLLYLHQIALANQDKTKDVNRARQILESCPEDRRNWEWHYLKRASHPELFDLCGHTMGARICRFSRDGRLLASASGIWGLPQAGETIVWDVETGQPRFQLHGHQGQILGLSFHPAGKLLATCDVSWSDQKKGVINIWDLSNGQSIAQIAESYSPFAIEFSGDGQLLAVACSDGIARTYSTATWQLVHNLKHHQHNVFSVSFHPGGQYLASGGRDGKLVVSSIETGQTVFQQDDLRDVRDVEFSPDGTLLAAATFGGQVLVWQWPDGELLTRHSNPNGSISSMRFGPDGSTLVVCQSAGYTQLINARTSQIYREFPSHQQFTYSGCISPDGTLVATCGSDSHVRIWSCVTPKPPSGISVQKTFISDVGAIPGQPLLVTGAAKNQTHFGQAAGEFALTLSDRNGKVVRSLQGHTDWTSKLAVAPGGHWIVSGSLDGTARIWETASGNCLHVLNHQGSRVADVAVLDDKRVVTGASDGKVMLWDVEEGKLLRQWQGSSAAITSLAAHCRGWLAATDDEGRLWFWSHERQSIQCHSLPELNRIDCLEFNPEGTLLVAGGHGSNVHFWNVDTTDSANQLPELNLLPRRIVLPEQQVCDLLFLPDGERLVSAGVNSGGCSIVRLWDLQTHAEALNLAVFVETQPTLAYSEWDQALLLGCNSLIYHYASSDLDSTERFKLHQEATLAWHETKAQESERERDAYKTLFHLTQELQHATKTRQLERRSNANAQLGRWLDAEQDLLKAKQLNPKGNYQFYWALLKLAQADSEGYRTHMEQLVLDRQATEDASQANDLAWALALTPDFVDRSELMLERSEYACQSATSRALRHSYNNTRALVNYRVGNLDEALKAEQTAIEAHGSGGGEEDLVVMALIQAARGDIDSAKSWLKKLSWSVSGSHLATTKTTQYSRYWEQRIQNEVLIREAEALIASHRTIESSGN
ncbi:MAG: serine/threonine protein kinase [Planctomycetales bacterium]|nr:serine/threonine protein kinase [Planctomycetales bacterium]